MKIYPKSLAILATGASAQQSMWGQCGGQGWTGQTTCVSGAACTYQNDWYSQCIAGGCYPFLVMSAGMPWHPPQDTTDAP